MADTMREWVDFFQKAGIPNDESATYAIIFNKNRIQRDMLLDLTKEYLKDMGITLLGDIIAILKHAKKVYETASRASVLKEATIIVSDEDIPVKKSVPQQSAGGSSVKRLLEHYTRKCKEAEESLPELPKENPNLRAIPTTSPVKKIVSLKSENPVQKLEVPVQKKIRVLPEHEGRYKVIMPKKTKLQAIVKKNDKKTVFERLGEGMVSSTTSDVPARTVKTSQTSSSIFARLGEVSSTSPVVEKAKHDALPYAGVFKNPIKNQSTGSMRADNEVEIPTSPSKTPLKSRLGGSGPGNTPTKKTPIAASPSSSSKRPDFLKKRDMTMLKITTEFTVEDEPKSLSSLSRKFADVTDAVRTTPVKRRASDDDLNIELPAPARKKVRFGEISHRIIPSNDYQAPMPKLSDKYKKLRITASLKKGLGIKARVGVVKPKYAKPFPKMVADSIQQRTPVQNRIQSKNKKNVLDRLG